MTDRKPTHDEYDVVLDFFPPESLPEYAYALVKFTYQIVDGRCERGPVQPLFHDIRKPDIKPAWQPGCDFWPHKLQTDVAVRGSAYAPDGGTVRSMRIQALVG